MSINEILIAFENSKNECINNLNIAFSIDNIGDYLYNQNQRDFIIESVFLKIFICWENFLENAFVGYLLGEQSLSGNIIQRYAFPIDFNHAQKMLIGTQKYVDWSNPEIIRKLSKIFLDENNPINTILSSIQSDIFDLKTIRNSAAHISNTTNKELDALATRKLRRPCSNYTVSKLILSIDPNAIPNNQTILNSYLTLLDAAAVNIANG